MEEEPPIWSNNIVRNYERIIEWCDAIILTCDINPKDYNNYMNRKSYDISEDLQNCINEWGANFGYLLKWVMMGINSINNNSRIPANCLIDKSDILKFEDVWNKHIKSERQILDDLKQEASAVKISTQKSLAIFYNEESDGYSSYSDYSEETTSSEDEEDEEQEEDQDEEPEEEEEEKHKRKKDEKKHRKK